MFHHLPLLSVQPVQFLILVHGAESHFYSDRTELNEYVTVSLAHTVYIRIEIGAKLRPLYIRRVSISRRVRYGRFHCMSYLTCSTIRCECICNNLFMLELWK